MIAATKKSRGAVGFRSAGLAEATVHQPVDHITVLVTDSGYSASKRFIKTNVGIKKIDFGAGTWFGVCDPVSVSDIVSLHEALTAIESLADMLVIRGAPIEPSYIGKGVRRLGDGGERSKFETPPQGRRWVLIDFDKIKLPKGMSLKKDPIALCNWLVNLLPAEFHDTSYHWQLSSSAGVFDTSTVSMHIWFWLARPIPDSDLKSWAKWVNERAGIKLVDPALFQHVQPHYTAAPIFEGMADPFPVRSGLASRSRHGVDLVLPQSLPPTRVGPRSPKVQAHGGAGFEYHLARIGDHPGGGGFHEPIVTAAASYVGEHGEDGTDIEHLYDLLSNAVLKAYADPAVHDAATVEQRASREHIMPAIESAIRKYGDQVSTRKRSQVVAGAQPHFKSTPVSVEAAQEALTAFANRAD